jgi:hypothetical protein
VQLALAVDRRDDGELLRVDLELLGRGTPQPLLDLLEALEDVLSGGPAARATSPRAK